MKRIVTLLLLLLCCAAFSFGAISFVTTSLPTAQVGVAYYQPLSVTGYTGSVTFSLVGGQLPNGFVLDEFFGVICTGTVSSGSATCNTTPQISSGGQPFTIQASDAGTHTSAQFQFSITVLGASAPTVTSSSPLPNAISGQAYAFTFAESGGTAPYNWIEASSSIAYPPGFILDPATGIFSSAQVTGSGTYTFLIQVGDTNGLHSSPKQFSLTIGTQALAITTTSPLPSGSVGVPYNNGSGVQLVATGGTSYTWGLTGTGSPPPGLMLSSSGDVFGTPTLNGVYQFQVEAIASGVSAGSNFVTATFTITIGSGNPNLTLTNGFSQAISSLTFNVPAGTPQSNTTYQQTVYVSTAAGSATLSFTPAASTPWLYLNGYSGSPVYVAQQGTTPVPLTVAVSTAGMTNGTSTSSSFQICIGNAINCLSVPVTLNVTTSGSGSGTLTSGPTSLTFTALQGASFASPSSQNLEIFNTLTSLGYSLTTSEQSGGNWILVNGTTATTGVENTTLLPVAINSAILPTLGVATYYGTITATDTSANVLTIAVTLVVSSSNSNITVTDISSQTVSSLTFNVPAGILPTNAAYQQTVYVRTTSGFATLNLVPPATVSWLYLDNFNVPPVYVSQTGTLAVPVTVGVNTTGLTSGSSTSSSFQICFSNTTNCVAIPVLLNVTGTAQGPTLTVTNGGGIVGSLTFSLPAGTSQTSTAAQQTVTVTPSAGPVTLAFTQQTQNSYLYLNSSSSPFQLFSVPTTGSQLTVAVSTAGLVANTTYYTGFSVCYAGTVTCVSIPVTILVQANAFSSLHISTASLPSATVGVSYSASINATGGQAPFNWSIVGNLPSGLGFNSSSGSSVTISGVPTTPGVISFTVRLTDSASSTVTQNLSLSVAASTATLSSLSPNSATTGGSGFSMVVTGSGFLNGAAVQWNGTSLATTYVSATQLTASVPSNLIAGPGIDTVTVSNPGGPFSNVLTFTVSGSSLAITTGATLPTATVGAPYSQGLVATAGTPPYKGWTLISGNLPSGISLSTLGGVLTGLLSGIPSTAGFYSFTIQITDSANATASVQFNLTVNPGTVSIAPNGIVNAASFDASSVSPGELVTIFGTNLGPAALITLQLNGAGNVTTSLAGTQVTFDGVPAPMIYTSGNQVSVVVPYAVTGKTSTQVQVSYQGQNSNVVTLAVSATQPGIFTMAASGQGPGAIVNQDGTINSSNNPAAVGAYVFVYATGEGQTNPSGVDGKPGASPAPQPVAQPVTATIGGIGTSVQYAGGVTGLVAGVLQVVVRIPQGVASGSAVPITIQVGGQTSQTGVTLAIQ